MTNKQQAKAETCEIKWLAKFKRYSRLSALSCIFIVSGLLGGGALLYQLFTVFDAALVTHFQTDPQVSRWLSNVRLRWHVSRRLRFQSQEAPR